MIINLKNSNELSSLFFVFRGSVSMEKDGWYGLSHIGEHIKCKVFDDLQDTLQENGINHNAYTSNNEIVFYFTGLEEYLSQFREELIRRIYTFDVSEEDVEKEKNIVYEEYLDAFTDKSHIHHLNYSRIKYGNYTPIGLGADILATTYQDVKDYHALQYEKPDMIINVSKDYTLEDDSLEFTDRSSKLKYSWDQNLEAPIEGGLISPEKSSIIYDALIEEEDSHIVNFINSMLSDGLNSPLYQEIREIRGLAYYAYAHNSNIGKLNHNIFGTMTSNKNVDIVHDALNDILSNKDKYMTKERFNLVKKSQEIKIKKSLINRHSNIQDVLDPSTKRLIDELPTLRLGRVLDVYDKYYDIDQYSRNIDLDMFQKEAVV